MVEQLVDENRPEAQNRVLLEEQYSPSLVVGHPVDGGAPVVFEPHPTFDNLFGRIEYGTDQGALYTSYRQLRPGAPASRQWRLSHAGGREAAQRALSSGRRSSAPCNRAS